MSNKATVAVVFFSDKAMLPGLHAALVSLAESNMDTNFELFIYADRLSKYEKTLLRKTWKNCHSSQKIEILDFSPKAVGDKLLGNSTTYGRLYIADLLPNFEKALYLDSDLIINTNLQPFFETIPDLKLLSADLTGNTNDSLDKDLFYKASINGKCFNAGVLGINLKRWRQINASEKCNDIAKLYSGSFKSADQALLNVAFHHEVSKFDEKYNTFLYPSSKCPDSIEDRIYHFVGSPKPWDLFGKRFHNSYFIWKNFFVRSAIRNRPIILYVNLQRIFIAFKRFIKLKYIVPG